jgi:hypothetical protein
MNKLTPLLASYRDRVIQNINFKINHETISVSFSEDEMIQFLGVKSFLFIEDEEVTDTTNILSSIEFLKDGFAEFVTEDEEYEEVTGLPNFSLDLIEKSLLIEAEAINIDGMKIKLTKFEN